MSGLVDQSADARSKTIGQNFRVRAWVNFNGTGTIAIRDSGNVSSLTDHGTGIYTVGFTNAMPDADYTAVVGGEVNNSNHDVRRNNRIWNFASTHVRVVTGYNGNSDTKEDYTHVTVAVIR